MRLYEILEARSNVPVDDAFAVLFAGKHKTSEISGVPPISFTSKGGVLEDYRISGNTTQNGTPTPEAPVEVNGVGMRTENLFDKVFASGYNLYQNGVPVAYSDDSRCATLEPIDVSDASVVTFSFTNAIQTDTKKYMYSLFDGSTLVTRVSNQASGSTIDVSRGNKLYLCVYSSLVSVDSAETTTDIMLNTGSTALPYEPYGYKLPPTVNGTEYPIYLGQVPTTRRIRKLVLDGTETGWQVDSSGDNKFFKISISDSTEGGLVGGIMCSHFVNIEIFTSNTTIGIWLTGRGELRIRPSGVSSISKDDFTAWLASEYAVGTPVTVLYVLATPETGIVNEPLHKIGDYADTISMAQAGVTIPTTAGTNTLTVGTTVQPSSVTIRGRIRPTL